MGISRSKSTLTPYFLWLIVDVLGLHRYYLEFDFMDSYGDAQLVSIVALVGYVRFVNINEYVLEANEDAEYHKRMLAAVAKNIKIYSITCLIKF